VVDDLRQITGELCRELDALSFGPPVTHVYNPLVYARAGWDAYLQLAGEAPGRVLLLGMNPGPFGMAQTGVPFGDVGMVRGWLGLDPVVSKPTVEHPRRPVQGLACPRSEVSGTRLWGWARERFGSPEAFFQRFVLANYCPLCFLEDSGRNRTPDKLTRPERDALYAVCDRALRRTVAVLKPERIIGIGGFAEDRAKAALGDLGLPIGRVLHPSPASPAANVGWEREVTVQLRALGVAV
jgi:single-strand selective monofunctional uracil DNA glycosylase